MTDSPAKLGSPAKLDKPTELIAFVGRISASEMQQWLDRLTALLPEADLRAFASLTPQQKQQCQLAIVANPDPHELAQLPNLVWVHSVWAGVERMLTELADKSFAIVRLVDPCLAQTMSEAVLAWTLYLHRDMPSYQRQQRQASWQQRPYVAAAERTVGILGLGELGTVSGQRLQANGFKVMGWSRRLKTIDGVQTVAGEAGLTELLSHSDIIVNLLPLTPQTRGLLGTARFRQCKQGAALINFGRGATVNEEDLLAVLAEGHLSHAVLDVFEQEPLASTHPFWSQPNITLLPHISAPTSVASASAIVANNIQRYLASGEIPSAVDRQQGY